MNEVDKLLAEVRAVAGNHEWLRRYFDDFHARCKQLSKAPASNFGETTIVPATIGDLDPRGHFEVSYAGVSAHVQFIAERAQDGACVASVRTLRICSVTGMVSEPTECFRFVRSGITTVDLPAGEQKKASIQDGVGSCVLFATLVLSLLAQAADT